MVEVGRMMSLFEVDEESSWSEALFDFGKSLGFEQVLYGVVPSKHSRLETAFLRSNYASDWRSHYDSERLAYIDPTVAHCLTSAVGVVWQPELFQTTPQRQMYEEACGHGIRAGVTLPVHGPSGEFGVISFASDALPDQHFSRRVQEQLPTLSMIRDYAFASSLHFIGTRDAPELPPRLTRRELEVLNWVMVGKSSWEISRITRCSEATVNFHIGNIRQKFNVNTRQQALVKAIRMGIITPEDPHR